MVVFVECALCTGQMNVQHCISCNWLTFIHFQASQVYIVSCVTMCQCRAPEGVRPNASPLKASADVWSLAATILFMMTNDVPYSGKTIIQIIAALQHPLAPPTVPDTLPVQLQSLLRQCFQFNPSRRPTAADMVSELQVNFSALINFLPGTDSVCVRCLCFLVSCVPAGAYHNAMRQVAFNYCLAWCFMSSSAGFQSTVPKQLTPLLAISAV